MAKDKQKNLTNRKQDRSPSSKPSTPISGTPGQPNTPEKQNPDLKAYLMMMVEDIKKDFNNSLKLIQENTAKELQVLKKQTNKNRKTQPNRKKSLKKNRKTHPNK